MVFSYTAFDLLRIDIHGVNMFGRYFLEKYSGYFISPLSVSGSTVETLFSQFKYSARGKLDAANYSYSRAVSLVKQVATTHTVEKTIEKVIWLLLLYLLLKKCMGNNQSNVKC